MYKSPEIGPIPYDNNLNAMRVIENMLSDGRYLSVVSKITGSFVYPKESGAVYNYLLNHGYETDEIEIVGPENTETKPLAEKSLTDTPRKKSVRLAVRGIKRGMLFGGVGGGIMVGIVLLIAGDIISASSVSLILAGIGIGVIWGAALGFLLAPQMSFSDLKSKSKPASGKVRISFRPHNQAEAHYFERNWHFKMI